MLSTLKHRRWPYSLSLRVAVCSVKEPLTYREEYFFSVADTSGCCKAVCFDQTKFHSIVENNGLVPRNIILKNNELIISSQSKIYATSAQDIQEDILAQAKRLIFPPDSEVIPIADAKRSPKKTMISVRGKIINASIK